MTDPPYTEAHAQILLLQAQAINLLNQWYTPESVVASVDAKDLNRLVPRGGSDAGQ